MFTSYPVEAISMRTGLICCLVLSSATHTLVAAPPSQPAAPKRPVTDTYWGVDVVDNYQYLEQVHQAEVLEWANAQNAYTRAWLDSKPQRQPRDHPGTVQRAGHAPQAAKERNRQKEHQDPVTAIEGFHRQNARLPRRISAPIMKTTR